MKASISSLLIAVIISFVGIACGEAVGPVGPPGPEGPRGPRGPQGEPGSEAVVFEYENVDFLPPNYNVFLDFPEYQALPSDAVLVYALWDIQKIDGEIFEIWRLLPQTTFPSDGTLVYNFNHTDVDVELFLDANFTLSNSALGPDELDDWVIRIVIVPGQYVTNGRTQAVDFNDYQAVKKHYNLPDMSPLESGVRHQRPEILKK